MKMLKTEKQASFDLMKMRSQPLAQPTVQVVQMTPEQYMKKLQQHTPIQVRTGIHVVKNTLYAMTCECFSPWDHNELRLLSTGRLSRNVRRSNVVHNRR